MNRSAAGDRGGDEAKDAAPDQPTTPLDRQIPLTGADCMLRAFDREALRMHSASHASQLVLQLGPGLDLGALREAIAEIGNRAPIVRAPIRRRWLFGPPNYELGLARHRPVPPLRVHHGAPPHEEGPWSPDVFAAALNQRFHGSAGELLRFDLIQYDDGTADLGLTWLHMLLDGSGSEAFVRALAAVAAGSRADLGTGWEHDDSPTALSIAERGRRARGWQAYLESFAAHPPGSPAGPLQRVAQRLRYRLETFTESDTSAIAALARDRAGFLTPVLYYMAAAIRAHHRLFEARGAVPQSYVVPLPVNIRPKGSVGAVFRTHVSMLWFQVRPEQARDFDSLLAELKRQRLAAIRDGLVESGASAIEFARWVPADVFRAMVRRTFNGELCSFFFAFTGDFLAGLDTFLGADVRNGFHVPAVPPSPGSCAAMSIHRGRLNLTHVFQDGALSEGEVELFAAHLRGELLRGTA